MWITDSLILYIYNRLTCTRDVQVWSSWSRPQRSSRCPWPCPGWSSNTGRWCRPCPHPSPGRWDTCAPDPTGQQNCPAKTRVSFNNSIAIWTSETLDVDPQRDDDASPMLPYRCMLRHTWMNSALWHKSKFNFRTERKLLSLNFFNEFFEIRI